MGKIFDRGHFFHHRYKDRGKAAIEILNRIDADIVGIVEASNEVEDHEYFLQKTALSKFEYRLAKGKADRGRQDLAFYYREPFEVLSIDENLAFYDKWYEDIDADGIVEELYFERRPLEVLFRNKITGAEFLIILVSFKSKGVFSTVDLYNYEYLSVANRKKLFAQSKKVRERIEQLLSEKAGLPFIVMGDMNDESGLDHFQKIIGASAVETIMGDVFHPDKILHSVLWHLKESQGANRVWTVEYKDPIVGNHRKHKALLDHIFVSPGLLGGDSGMKFVVDSGRVYNENKITKIASDHFPIYCEFEF